LVKLSSLGFSDGKVWQRVTQNDIPGILDYLEAKSINPSKDQSVRIL
jgi:hypothetical protein